MKKLFLMIIPMLLIVAANAQRVPVEVSALPQPLPRFLNTSYPGYVIDTAYKVISNNYVIYETVITKGTIKETLVLMKKGHILISIRLIRPWWRKPKSMQVNRL